MDSAVDWAVGWAGIQTGRVILSTVAHGVARGRGAGARHGFITDFPFLRFGRTGILLYITVHLPCPTLPGTVCKHAGVATARCV
jgi:hypothetical protein